MPYNKQANGGVELKSAAHRLTDRLLRRPSAQPPATPTNEDGQQKIWGTLPGAETRDTTNPTLPKVEKHEKHQPTLAELREHEQSRIPTRSRARSFSASVSSMAFLQQFRKTSFKNKRASILTERNTKKIPLWQRLTWYDDPVKELWINPGMCRIHHESKFRKSWDATTLVLLVYLVFTLAVNVAFDNSDHIQESIYLFLDCWFIVDVFLNFISTFDDGNFDLVTDFRKISNKYMRTWLFIDLVSAIPFERMFFFGTTDLDLLKSAKLLRLLKLFRIFRLGRLLNKIRRMLGLKHKSIFLVKFFFVIIIVDHWLGCLYWLWTETFEQPGSWYFYDLKDMEGGPIFFMGPTAQYLVVTYWAVQTVVSMGFGNTALPLTDMERVFVIGSQVVGTFVYAYGLTNMSDALYYLDGIGVTFKNTSDLTNEWIKRVGIMRIKGRMHAKKILNFLYYKQNSTVDVFPNDGIAERSQHVLSRRLCKELPYYMMLDLFPTENDKLFSRLLPNTMDQNFKLDLAQILRGRAYFTGDMICGPRNEKRRIYMLRQGECFAFKGKGDKKKQFRLGRGFSWGERALLLGKSMRFSVQASTACEVYTFEEKAFLDLLTENWPVEKAALIKAWTKCSDRQAAKVQDSCERWFHVEFVHSDLDYLQDVRKTVKTYQTNYVNYLEGVHWQDEQSHSNLSDQEVAELSAKYSGAFDVPDSREVSVKGPDSAPQSSVYMGGTEKFYKADRLQASLMDTKDIKGGGEGGGGGAASDELFPYAQRSLSPEPDAEQGRLLVVSASSPNVEPFPTPLVSPSPPAAHENSNSPYGFLRRKSKPKATNVAPVESSLRDGSPDAGEAHKRTRTPSQESIGSIGRDRTRWSREAPLESICPMQFPSLNATDKSVGKHPLLGRSDLADDPTIKPTTNTRTRTRTKAERRKIRRLRFALSSQHRSLTDELVQAMESTTLKELSTSYRHKISVLQKSAMRACEEEIMSALTALAKKSKN